MLVCQTRSKPAWQQTAPSFQLSPNERHAADADEEGHALGQFNFTVTIINPLTVLLTPLSCLKNDHPIIGLAGMYSIKT